MCGELGAQGREGDQRRSVGARDSDGARILITGVRT